MAPSTTTYAKRPPITPLLPPSFPSSGIDPLNITLSSTLPHIRSSAFSPSTIPAHRRAPSSHAHAHSHAPNPKRNISLPATASAFGLATGTLSTTTKRRSIDPKSSSIKTGTTKLSSTMTDFGLSVPDRSHASDVRSAVRITRATAARLGSAAAARAPSSSGSTTPGTPSSARRIIAKHTRFVSPTMTTPSSPPLTAREYDRDGYGSSLPTAFGRRSVSHSPSSSLSTSSSGHAKPKPKMTIDPAFASGSGTTSASGSGSGSTSMNGTPPFRFEGERYDFPPFSPSEPSRVQPPRYIPQYPLPPQPYREDDEIDYIEQAWTAEERDAWEKECTDWEWKKFWDHEKEGVASVVARGGDVGCGPGKGGWDEYGRKAIDLVFCLDATGSMGSYLRSATENIRMIVAQIAENENLEREDDLRVAVVAYRDLPEQCSSFITKECHFTSNIDELHHFIGSLSASGGGDGPECTASALHNAYERLQWRENSAKCCILVTDAPPHGIGESGDFFPDGEPKRHGGYDPLVTARQFAQRGIPIFVVACEPGLSTYKNGVEFYQALCTITSGMMLPLKTADLLAKAVIGAVLEHVEMETLVREIGAEVAAKIQTEGSVDLVIAELHRTLQLRGDVTKQVRVDNVYNETASYKHNVDAWTNAQNLKEGRSNLIPWNNKDHRFTESYRSSYGGYHTSRPLPSRRRSESPVSAVSASIPPPTPPKIYNTRSKAAKSPKMAVEEEDDDDMSDAGSGSDSDSDMAAKRRSKSSPTKVVDSFAAFKAKPGAFGALSTNSKIGSPPSVSAETMAAKPAFRGMRPAKPAGRGLGMDEDSEGEEDERNLPIAAEDAAELGADTLGFAMASISLDQAKRIANQSIWRMRG